MAALHITFLFTDNWAISYGIPTHVLPEYGTRFVSKLFKLLCAFLGVKNLTTTAYHLHTHRQVERFNNGTFARLWQYVAEQYREGDIPVQPLMHVFSSQVHQSTNLTPFSRVLSRNPLILPLLAIRQLYLPTWQRLRLHIHWERDAYIEWLLWDKTQIWTRPSDATVHARL